MPKPKKKMPGPRASTVAALWRANEKLFPTTSNVNLRVSMPPGTGPFGDDTDPEDSERLRRLRSIIDEEIGWASAEEEESGDYEERLRQVAKALAFFDVKRVVKGKVKR